MGLNLNVYNNFEMSKINRQLIHTYSVKQKKKEKINKKIIKMKRRGFIIIV